MSKRNNNVNEEVTEEKVVVEDEKTTVVSEEVTEEKTSKIKEVAKKHGEKIGLVFGGAVLLGLGYILGRRSDSSDSDVYNEDDSDSVPDYIDAEYREVEK